MIREIVQLFKARCELWRADRGTAAWYRALAKVRYYNGDDLGAAVAAFMASVREAFETLAEGIGEFVTAYCEARDAALRDLQTQA
jgi:hypothetical protein